MGSFPVLDCVHEQSLTQPKHAHKSLQSVQGNQAPMSMKPTAESESGDAAAARSQIQQI